jgi:hypothetical protein
VELQAVRGEAVITWTLLLWLVPYVEPAPLFTVVGFPSEAHCYERAEEIVNAPRIGDYRAVFRCIPESQKQSMLNDRSGG